MAEKNSANSIDAELQQEVTAKIGPPPGPPPPPRLPPSTMSPPPPPPSMPAPFAPAAPAPVIPAAPNEAQLRDLGTDRAYIADLELAVEATATLGAQLKSEALQANLAVAQLASREGEALAAVQEARAEVEALKLALKEALAGRAKEGEGAESREQYLLDELRTALAGTQAAVDAIVTVQASGPSPHSVSVPEQNHEVQLRKQLAQELDRLQAASAEIAVSATAAKDAGARVIDLERQVIEVRANAELALAESQAAVSSANAGYERALRELQDRACEAEGRVGEVLALLDEAQEKARLLQVELNEKEGVGEPLVPPEPRTEHGVLNVEGRVSEHSYAPVPDAIEALLQRLADSDAELKALRTLHASSADDSSSAGLGSPGGFGGLRSPSSFSAGSPPLGSPFARGEASQGVQGERDLLADVVRRLDKADEQLDAALAGVREVPCMALPPVTPIQPDIAAHAELLAACCDLPRLSSVHPPSSSTARDAGVERVSLALGAVLGGTDGAAKEAMRALRDTLRAGLDARTVAEAEGRQAAARDRAAAQSMREAAQADKARKSAEAEAATLRDALSDAVNGRNAAAAEVASLHDAEKQAVVDAEWRAAEAVSECHVELGVVKGRLKAKGEEVGALKEQVALLVRQVEHAEVAARTAQAALEAASHPTTAPTDLIRQGAKPSNGRAVERRTQVPKPASAADRPAVPAPAPVLPACVGVAAVVLALAVCLYPLAIVVGMWAVAPTAAVEA